jgi:membrane protease YdiL (CAAX protease family)
MTDGKVPETAAGQPDRARRTRLWSEFAVLFVAVPVAQIAFFELFGPFIPLAVVFAASCVLLALTPGFRWREIVDCRGLARQIPLILILVAVCIFVVFAIVLALIPERLLSFPRYAPERYALVIALYPFLSVLPQEVAYRLLFFRRYGALFRNDASAIAASAFVFALAHGFFENGISISLSFIGGVVFAWAYVRSGSFPLVWILHSLAGQIIFTSGLGIYFYHGAVS